MYNKNIDKNPVVLVIFVLHFVANLELLRTKKCLALRQIEWEVSLIFG